MGTKQRSKIKEEVRLPTTAMEIWELIGDFNGVPAWHPIIVDSSLESDGKVRRVVIADEGGESLEQLLTYNRSKMSYSYKVLEGPMPVSDYRATVSVRDTLDDNAVVTWEAGFVADGVSKEEAEREVRHFFKMATDSLKEIFK
jgi:hypothetical protein